MYTTLYLPWIIQPYILTGVIQVNYPTQQENSRVPLNMQKFQMITGH